MKALSEPNPTTEAAAWKAVEKSVEHLYNFFNYARSLEGLLPSLLTTICLNPDAPVSQNSALVKLLGRVFLFAFHFDELKMGTPAISNDFSYYRRVLSRMRNAGTNDGKKQKKTQVTEEIANLMSFHYAYPTPVMKVLIAAAVQMPTAASLVPGLAEIANVACSMAQNPDEDQKLLLCLMTGCIILIDHLAGVFHKKSPVRIRQCVILLRNTAGTDSLMNSLRFSTLHLNDDTTPPNIAKLFE